MGNHHRDAPVSYSRSERKPDADTTIIEEVIVCDGCGYVMGVYGNLVKRSQEGTHEHVTIVFRDETYHAHLPPPLKYIDSTLKGIDKDFSKRYSCLDEAIQKIRIKHKEQNVQD